MEARVLSVNIARPREVLWRGQRVKTGIYKEPVSGPVRVGPLGLAGDLQADPHAHGGPLKAVYLYPAEHYAAWRSELPDQDLPPGMFGENLTTEGILEQDVHVGDQFQIGSAILEVTAPRWPCYKLGLKFGRMDLIERFLASGRSGFYLSVAQEGEIEAGQRIARLRQRPENPTIYATFGATMETE